MVCLDTSFVVDLLRKRSDVDKLVEKFDHLGEQIYVPSPVVVELISGANLKQNKEDETNRIKQFLATIIVLPLDEQSAIKAGEIEAELERSGEIIETEDIMIAAITLQNEETLVTRNVKHFRRIEGLNLEEY